jgi:hypothetical protein
VLPSSILSSICGVLLRGGVSPVLVADASLDVLLMTLLEGTSSTGSSCPVLRPGASANTLPEGIELCSSCNLLLLLSGIDFLTAALFLLLLGYFNASQKWQNKMALQNRNKKTDTSNATPPKMIGRMHLLSLFPYTLLNLPILLLNQLVIARMII